MKKQKTSPPNKRLTRVATSSRLVTKRTGTTYLSKKEKKALYKQAAFYHAIGYTNRRIAKKMKKNEVTIGKWLRDPDCQKFLQRYEDDVFESAERRFKNLTVASVDRINKIVKKGEDDVALKAIEMIFKMDGHLEEKRRQGDLESLLAAGGGGMVGAFALNNDQASNAMKFLENTRDEKEISND